MLQRCFFLLIAIVFCTADTMAQHLSSGAASQHSVQPSKQDDASATATTMTDADSQINSIIKQTPPPTTITAAQKAEIDAIAKLAITENMLNQYKGERQDIVDSITHAETQLGITQKSVQEPNVADNKAMQQYLYTKAGLANE